MEHSISSVRVLLELSLFNIDVSITSAVLVIWAAALAVFVLSYLAARDPSLLPGKIQNLIEIIYEFFESQTKGVLKEETGRWMPFIYALFCFILVSNLLGMVPNVPPVTANINVTVALAVAVFFVYHIAGIRDHGLWNYLKSLVPKGVPVYVMPLLLVIEMIGHLARPFSLAVRLFANMTSGHLVMLTLVSLILFFKNIWVAGFPLLGGVAVGLLEVFVAFVQAYVFAYLAALYIGLAIYSEA